MQNQKGTWEFINAQGNRTIPQPTLSLLPTHVRSPQQSPLSVTNHTGLQDKVADWKEAAKMLGSADYIPHLTTHVRVRTSLYLKVIDTCPAVHRGLTLATT